MNFTSLRNIFALCLFLFVAKEIKAKIMYGTTGLPHALTV